MSSHSSGPCSRAATVALCGLLLALATAVGFVASAQAAQYKMVLCAANNGSNAFDVATNTRSAQNPDGIFSVENHCGPAPDPAGNNAFLRIYETQDSGSAAEGAYASISWTVPPWVAILGAGGYTREPGAFNDGWRGRFWAEGFNGDGPYNILMQGTGAANAGVSWAPTSTFASHLWPFGGWGYYRRFIVELTCMRPAGCDRGGWNDYDANTLTLTLADVSPASASFQESGDPLLGGAWVRGIHSAPYSLFDQGSGLRVARLRIDGSERQAQDFGGRCDRDSSGPSGEFARSFKPCPEGSQSFAYDIDTASLSDGAHAISICAQDYAQWWGDRAGGSDQSCDQRTIRTDNTAPAAPAGLTVTSSNPNRYLSRFGARFALPADPGSPIVGARYYVTDDQQGGKVVAPEKFVAENALTSISGIEGPGQPGAYTLHVALQDEVGFLGAYATAPIPHDTTPPAAPQSLHVSGPGDERRVLLFDVAWKNLTDAGSPITAAHYRVVDDLRKVVVQTKTLSAQSPEAITGIESPAASGSYSVQVWLSDAEGNVGAPATVAVPRDATPPAAPQDVFVSPPGASRSEQGFDLRWRNITDTGSPIAAAHYEVFSGEGQPVVGPKTVEREGIDSIAELEVPAGRGDYTLRLWLSDAEGNVGAPASAPLSYECEGSPAAPVASSLSVGFEGSGQSSILVEQGAGATLGGALRGGEVASQPLCIFDRVLSEGGRKFFGTAMSGSDGSFRFNAAAGPSREFTIVHRAGQREVSATATLRTRVHPTLVLGRKVVHQGGFATFHGEIPPPANDGVVVVLQVRDSAGHWRAFRRYRTRGGGRYSLRYRFTRKSARRIVYPVRAQVRGQLGYPYEAGDSPTRRLVVVP